MKKRFIKRYKAPRGGFGKVHNEYFDKLARDLIEKRRRVELDFRSRPNEYLQYADKGFTVGRAIRDRSGSVVKVNGKISIPDLVDYKEDRIYDLKTVIWSLIFCLPKDTCGSFDRFTAEEVCCLIVHRNRHQFEKYVKAYWAARKRIPTLMIAIEGFDRRIVCGFHPGLRDWFIVEDEIKKSTIKWWISQP